MLIWSLVIPCKGIHSWVLYCCHFIASRLIKSKRFVIFIQVTVVRTESTLPLYFVVCNTSKSLLLYIWYQFFMFSLNPLLHLITPTILNHAFLKSFFFLFNVSTELNNSYDLCKLELCDELLYEFLLAQQMSHL